MAQQSLVTGLICNLLLLLLIVVVARALLSWFPPGGTVLETIRRFSITSTEWIMGPFRRLIPPLRLGGMALDMSFLVLVIGISILRSVVCSI